MKRRVKANFDRLMVFRGYKEIEEGDDYFIYCNGKNKIGMMYIESDEGKDYIGAISLKIFIMRMISLNMRRSILVSKKALCSKTRSMVAEFLNYLYIEFITTIELDYPVVDNILSFRVYKVDNKKELLEKLNIKNPKKELSRINIDDPICIYNDFMESDIICVNEGSEITYKIVSRV